MNKKLYVFIALIGFTGIAFSQIAVVKGNVVSAEDNKPITGVHILIKSTQKGMTTDTNGHFDLQNVTLPVTLEISHISYEKKELRLSKVDVEYENVITLNISLILRTENLNDIAIYADKVHQLERLVYDFEVDDSSLYLICNKKDKKTLRVYDFNDYLKRSQILPKGCSELGFDLQKHLFAKQPNHPDYWRISNKDTVLTYIEYDSVINGVGAVITNPNNYVPNKCDNFSLWLKDYYGISITSAFVEYNQKINLIGSLQNGIYFSYEKGWNRQYKELYRIYVDRNGNIKYKKVYYAFYDIDDWLNPAVKSPNDSIVVLGKIKMNNRTLAQIQLLQKSGNILEEYISRTIFTKGNLNLLNIYATQITPITVYFKVLKENLYILNFERGIIYKLDSDNILVSVIQIDKVFMDKASYQIMFNVDGTRCFLKINKYNSYIALQELDIATGKYIRTINLIKPRVEKIRIVGNYIYYTTAVEGKNTTIERWLWKQDLY
ncbi:MAG: carboxypeptidase-like regulatory domain-containing protein [Bacteroidales bacterium]|jgi:hypothetical protein|nr:carboxypeptidase-like regulatory domain-containing protein [Bacteroidales bacterium]